MQHPAPQSEDCRDSAEPGLEPAIRDRLTAAAVRMAQEVRYDNLGTFEFLVNAEASASDEARFAFIEANPRLQVEHTVTEEVTGIDIVKLQIQLAAGRTLAELRMQQAGHSQAARLCDAGANQHGIDARRRQVRNPAAGRSRRLRRRRGPACAPIRSPTPDTRPARTSTLSSPSSSRISHSADFARCGDEDVSRAMRIPNRGRSEQQLDFCKVCCSIPISSRIRVYTPSSKTTSQLWVQKKSEHRRLFFDRAIVGSQRPASSRPMGRRAGAKIDASDPLAVLHHGKSESSAPSPFACDYQRRDATSPRHRRTGEHGSRLRLQGKGTIVSVDVSEGDRVHRGQQLFVMEAMKMEHVIAADKSGIVRRINSCQRRCNLRRASARLHRGGGCRDVAPGPRLAMSISIACVRILPSG